MNKGAAGAGRQGWLYCLVNSAMPGICKIGATRSHPIQRTKEMGAPTGVPVPFTLAYYRDFLDAFDAETVIHKDLGAHRVNESREFFRISEGDAIAAIEKVVKKVASEGLIGGASQARRNEVPTPWADLFASFDPSDNSELTPAEQLGCRALEEDQRIQAREKSQKRRPRSGY